MEDGFPFESWSSRGFFLIPTIIGSFSSPLSPLACSLGFWTHTIVKLLCDNVCCEKRYINKFDVDFDFDTTEPQLHRDKAKASLMLAYSVWCIVAESALARWRKGGVSARRRTELPPRAMSSRPEP